MAIEHGVDGAAGRNLNLTGKATQQAFADLACPPVRLLPFEVEDGGLHLLRQLVAVTPGPAGTVRQSFQTGFFVEVTDLLGCVAHPKALQVLWGTALSEPRETKAPKSVKAHAFGALEDAQDVSLLQGSALRCCQEITMHAGDVISKFTCENLGNVYDAHSVRRFWLLFPPTPKAATHVEHTAIGPEIGRAQRKRLADSQSCPCQQRKEHRVLALLDIRQDALQIGLRYRRPALFVFSHHGKLNEIVIPFARIDLLALLIHC